jgi:hypothetical protein
MLYVFFWVIPRRMNFVYICHMKFRRRGITQKKANTIQNTAKVWNQEYFTSMGRKLQRNIRLFVKLRIKEYKIQMPRNYPEESRQRNKCICVKKKKNRKVRVENGYSRECRYLFHVLSDLLVSLPYWSTGFHGAHMPLLHEAFPAVEHGLVGCNRAPWRILRQNRGVRPSHLPQDVSAARRLLLNLSMLRTRFLVRWRRQFLVRHLKWKWILLWLLTVYCLLGMKTMSLGKYNKSFVVCVKVFA